VARHDSVQGGEATYVSAMHDIAHKIHGGAAMFGFPTVSVGRDQSRFQVNRSAVP
jgi:HPt (histidine-containing phosphotransfer) domain-containing protein